MHKTTSFISLFIHVRIEYTGTDIADIRSIEAVPPDTETLGLVKAALA